MGIRTLIGSAVVALTLAAAPVGAAANGVTREEAHAIGVNAYLYLYPLVTMDLSRRQFTNVAPGQEFGRGPMNTVVSVPSYPPADFRGVVRSNFDTLYSISWIDMREEPVVVSAPDTGGRYYLLPMLDMWTDVFASPGWRTTGTAAMDVLLTPPGWTGDVPAGLTRIAAPTPIVWMIGRTKTDGPPDYEAVHRIQAGYKVTPLSAWGKPASEPPPFVPDPSVDMKTPPKEQVDAMTAEAFFAYAAELLKEHPPHITDEPMLAQLRKIGFVAGESFDLATAPEAVRDALSTVPEDGRKLMAWKMPTLARIVNGWSMNTDTMGVYGNYYLKRAIVAQFGLGANLPEDAIYPMNIADNTGKPLHGANRYVLRFEASELPPVDAFWSVTLYDEDGFQVANPLERFAISSWMPLKTGGDGSLELIIQHDDPGPELQSNWLPAPDAPFNLTMRLYAPKSAALTGKWNPPAVVLQTAVPAVVGQ